MRQSESRNLRVFFTEPQTLKNLDVGIVDVAPFPVLTLFRGLDQRVLRLVEMRAGMAIL